MQQPFLEFQADRPPFQWSSIEIDRSGKFILALANGSAFLFDAFDGKLVCVKKKNEYENLNVYMPNPFSWKNLIILIKRS